MELQTVPRTPNQPAPVPAPDPDPGPEAGPAPPTTPGQAQAPAEGGGGDRPGPKLRSKARPARRKHDLPAWLVSALVHVAVLGLLAVATVEAEKAIREAPPLDSALVKSDGSGAEELVHIYADPSEAPREEAVGDTTALPSAGGEVSFSAVGLGSGSPSATPRVRVGTAVGERTSLPSVKVAPQLSGLAMLPAAPARDLSGGGRIAGDVAFETGDIGVALDQLAREILAHLARHKLTVLWLFDESESMKDDQRAIREKFDRVAGELRANLDDDKKAAGALTHAVIGFGEAIHFELEKPTADIDQIGRAIDRLRKDNSGTENVFQAVQEVVRRYGGLAGKDRRLLIVLVTDESGDDGAYVEEARQLAVSRKVPIYVIGRQSLFGYDRAHLRYEDPVTKDVYWPAIRRGPETADIELLQWDGLHERWDEQPSGFAPYELARLARDTGGIYFLLPSEENMRVRRREQAYSIATLKEYIPDYSSRVDYLKARAASPFRRALFEIIAGTRNFPFRRHFPVNPPELAAAAEAEYPVVTQRLNALIAVEKQLRSMAKLRDREPEKRWQAHYDLMLAQVMTYQIKAYEYRACLEEMVRTMPKPKVAPGPDLIVEWVLDHSRDRKAPQERTEKVYQEAESLLKRVIERHPKTPWADLAQDELNRGLGVQRNEWHHNPQYNERQKLVPKY